MSLRKRSPPSVSVKTTKHSKCDKATQTSTDFSWCSLSPTGFAFREDVNYRRRSAPPSFRIFPLDEDLYYPHDTKPYSTRRRILRRVVGTNHSILGPQNSLGSRKFSVSSYSPLASKFGLLTTKTSNVVYFHRRNDPFRKKPRIQLMHRSQPQSYYRPFQTGKYYDTFIDNSLFATKFRSCIRRKLRTRKAASFVTKLKHAAKRESEESYFSASEGEEEVNRMIEKQNLEDGRRRNRILLTDELGDDTKIALAEEEARRKRIEEEEARRLQELADAAALVEPEVIQIPRLILQEEPLIEVHPKFVSVMKEHQVDGCKFLWQNVCESVEMLQQSPGSGAILAHCMGLGKTLTTIAFIHTLISRRLLTNINTCLIIAPVNVQINWLAEFERWCPPSESGLMDLKLYDFGGATSKTERGKLLQAWTEQSGIMIMGYTIFASLSKRAAEEKDDWLDNFLDPDLLVCDEGHVLKNPETDQYTFLNQLPTRRRIILTGTPLQNNLDELYAMASFVKPSLLGTIGEFHNRFIIPIRHGEVKDASDRDVRIMKRRVSVLNRLLQGFCHRRGFDFLKRSLPPKYEFVLFLRSTPVQCEIYENYLRHVVGVNPQNGVKMARGALNLNKSLFADFTVLGYVMAHPYLVVQNYNEAQASDTSGRSKILSVPPNWFRDVVDEGCRTQVEISSKFMLVMKLVESIEQVGDKVLIFSQSLKVLDLLESMLALEHRRRSGRNDFPFNSWVPGLDYYRIDGQVTALMRTEMVNSFNDPLNLQTRLFLISTGAGSLGINLIGANRVILLDACWNPSQDLQAMFRAYRFGQEKPVFVYRLIAAGAMEEKVYDRQVLKLALANRVVDKMSIGRHFTREEVAELYKFDSNENVYFRDGRYGEVPRYRPPTCRILTEILAADHAMVKDYVEHDSLLEHCADEDLTDEERIAAWDEYELDKRSSIASVSSGNATPQAAPIVRRGRPSSKR